MKIFQILNNFCHWDATSVVPNLEFAKEHYAPDIVFVEAPDYVFEGWGFNEYQTGDARFVKPVSPDGWLYDDKTGTFYQEGWTPPKSDTERIFELEEKNKLLSTQLKAAVDRTEFLEDVLQEMILTVVTE